MGLIKRLYGKLIAKLTINELKKGVFPETSTRIVAHYSIIEMDKMGKNNIKIDYTNEETGDELTITVIRHPNKKS